MKGSTLKKELKELKFYILFLILVVYHLLLREWWTPLLYYSGTYLMLITLLYDKYKTTKNWNYIKLLIYFSLIYLYLSTSINKDVELFYKKLHIREIALGFGGVGIIVLMFFKREKG